jgi:hypothetical protein
VSLLGETVHEQFAFAWPSSILVSGATGFLALVPAVMVLAVALALHGGAAGKGLRDRIRRGAP